MITYENAINAHYRQEFYHVDQKNRDGSQVRCRVNGKTRTWKTYPEPIRMDLKRYLDAAEDEQLSESTRQQYRERVAKIEAMKGRYFSIPVKYGLKECFYIDNFGYYNDAQWNMTVDPELYYPQITEEQLASFNRLMERNSEKPEQIEVCAPWYDDPVGTLMVKYTHILIGIEPDGYAHS